MSGVPTASAARRRRRPADHRHAASAPSAEAEQRCRWRLVTTCATSSPRAQHLEPAASTPSGDGRKSAGTHPVRVSSSHSTMRPASPATRATGCSRRTSSAGAIGRGQPAHAAPSRSGVARLRLDRAPRSARRLRRTPRSPSIASARGRPSGDRHDLQHPARPPREHDDAIGHEDGLVDVVRHVEDRLARPLPDRQQLLLHELARLGVERGERLVHQQHGRIDGQRARDAHALPHAARELVRIAASRSRRARSAR